MPLHRQWRVLMVRQAHHEDWGENAFALPLSMPQCAEFKNILHPELVEG